MADKKADARWGWVGPPQYQKGHAHAFMIKQQLARVRTTVAVKVLAVYPGDPHATPPTPTTIDIHPMIDQVDSQGRREPHGTVYGVVVSRQHFGNTAILADPGVGDVGVMSIADRDISSMMANKGARSAPGSNRRFDFSDGIYTQTLWAAEPAAHFIDFRGGDVTISTTGNLSHNVGGSMTMSTTGGPATIDDGNGNKMVLDASAQQIRVVPKDASTKVYLGGDPANGGVFQPVMTSGGPSDNVFAHVSGPV